MTVRRAALTGFALILLLGILVEIVAARFFSPSYDWIRNTVSDLGVTTCTTLHNYYGAVELCSPAHAWVNASMAVGGLAMIGLATVRVHTAGFDRFAGLSWVVAGVSTLAMALVPQDVSPELHAFVSIPQLVALPLAVFIGSLKYRGVIGGAGRVVGAVGLGAGLWLLLDVSVYTHAGLLERMILWPAFLWAVFVSAFGRLRERRLLAVA
ncbi:DUF998 domain-containing protein [Corynebacterium hylobatis]|uniref:DUF998 domain-containing protein n=1 Tax=Corynebacterium hylobatis TaxID=1859290 RepID=UPI0013DF271B|nr:DUF998 domain-containing protein [Corynebacterium hylobatis]